LHARQPPQASTQPAGALQGCTAVERLCTAVGMLLRSLH
jgi:hypothetical protein